MIDDGQKEGNRETAVLESVGSIHMELLFFFYRNARMIMPR
jgi:hypothetical protein